MTDTVNVPVEALNAALDALDLENKESDFFVSEHYDELRCHLLAAAPKADTFEELKPNDIAYIIEQNADYDANGLYNASQLAERIYRTFREHAHPEAQKGEPVAIVPSGCTGSVLIFDPGSLHINKDGSGYIVIEEDDFTLEDDRNESPDGPEGSVHWISRLDASEVAALRDFLNGASPAPSSELLEAAEALMPIARKDTRIGKAGDELREALNALEDAIDKHKGPQS